MEFHISLKKCALVIFGFLIIILMNFSPVFAQNSSLAVKGNTEAFGNLKVVNQYGHVVFADQPDRATVAMLKDQGVGMVINIRGEAENEGFNEQKAVESEGISYLKIPYMDGREIDGHAINEILDILKITEQSGTKVFLHCTHSQRAGSLLGIALAKAGYSKEEANKFAQNAGMTSEFITRIHNAYLETIN